MTALPDLLQRLHDAFGQVAANPLELSTGKNAVREHNKRMDAVWATLLELSATREGRAGLEDLVWGSPSIGLRVMAANMVMRWDGFLARDVLEEVVVSGGGQIVRPMTMTVALQAPDRVKDAALSLLNLNRFPSV